MPVQSETSRIQYTGNASSVTPYAVPFLFLDIADLIVVITDEDGEETILTETTDYSVTGAGVDSGGEVVTVSPVPGTSTVTIYREPEAVQLAEFQATGRLPAQTLTDGLDRLTMIAQALLRKISRCLRFTDSSDDVDAITGSDRASKVLGFDSSAEPQLYDTAALTALLNLSGSVTPAPTAYWSDDGQRAVKVPDFVGQVGVQMNEGSLWIATATTAGSWAAQVLDEDDMASDSARRPPSQQSVKAYADAGDAASVAAANAVIAAEPITKTIAIFRPQHNEPPSSNFATIDTRNGHPVLDFDTTTQEAAVFSGRIPEGVSLANGIVVYVQWSATSATTGTIGWDVAFERIADGGIDIDSDSFGAAQTITAATVPGTSGITKVTSVAFSQAQLPASLAPGDAYRLRIRRDVSNDTATGDAELVQVEGRLG